MIQTYILVIVNVLVNLELPLIIVVVINPPCFKSVSTRLLKTPRVMENFYVFDDVTSTMDKVRGGTAVS